MRTAYWIWAPAGLVGFVAILQTGCWSDYNDIYQPLTNLALADGGNPECSGDPSAKNITDTCGVFVQADAPGATEDGTMEHPYKTLQKALSNLHNKTRVYACASAPFAEAVTISAGVEVYGGFTCAKGWAWSQDARTQL